MNLFIKITEKHKKPIIKGFLLTILVLAFTFAGALPIATGHTALAANTPTSSGTPSQDCSTLSGQAQTECQCQNNEVTNSNGDQTLCGGNPQASDTCNPSSPTYAQDKNSGLCSDIVNDYLNPIINFIGVGVGLIIIISLVIGGIQYAAAGDNPQSVEAARNRITNSLIALLAFALMYAILQFLIPGGIF